MMTRIRVSLLIVGSLLIMLGAMVGLATAQEPASAPEATPSPEATAEPASDAYCLLCHTKPDQVWHLPSGENLSVTIDPTVLANSVHGTASSEGPLACADCHPNFRYPHPATLSQTIREFQVERYAICRDCHAEQYQRAQDSVHGEFLREGRLEAATCIDCHGGHDIQTPDEPRQRISLTCGRCHGAIFETFRSSIHGTALLDESNPDVPTCIDCHGVHNIENPLTTEFRSGSPDLCATCHADAELMGKYNISTHVFDSYVADFHGSTVELFEHESPGVVTNKAVCFDCHGVHDIQAVDDAGVASIRETLVTTCRQCHPGASADFSAAWIGHYPATPETHPLLFFVRSLYNVLLPVGLIIVGILIVSDLVRRLRRGNV
ncbi:MAG: cytochrome c3 family protein [Anaerolineae bacterium]|nr:cytochrome c3 family protein [Anaerolineae bacterium]